jgi:hypothetical protein
MTNQLLPRDCAVVVAAKIAGLSAATFKAQCLDTGAIKTEGGRVLLASLAQHLRRPIDETEYLRAHRSRDVLRTKARQRTARKRARAA